jgi:GNAT superfamily N-acetyltransferase
MAKIIHQQKGFRMPPTLSVFTHDDILNHMDGFAELLCDAVNHGASVNFVAPMAPPEAIPFWQKVAAAVQSGDIILLAVLEDGEIIGTVQLALAWQPNAPHRAEVQKLLVHSTKQRRGLASQLMTRAEAVALENGRWLLFLDTYADSGAAIFYERIGYTRGGIIAMHSLNADGEFADTVIFYKILRKENA